MTTIHNKKSSSVSTQRSCDSSRTQHKHTSSILSCEKPYPALAWTQDILKFCLKIFSPVRLNFHHSPAGLVGSSSEWFLPLWYSGLRLTHSWVTLCSLQHKRRYKKHTSKYIALLSPAIILITITRLESHLGVKSLCPGQTWFHYWMCKAKVVGWRRSQRGWMTSAEFWHKYEFAVLYLSLRLELGLCSSWAKWEMKRLLYHWILQYLEVYDETRHQDRCPKCIRCRLVLKLPAVTGLGLMGCKSGARTGWSRRRHVKPSKGWRQ